MNMRMLVLMTLAMALSACRANLPRPDAEAPRHEVEIQSVPAAEIERRSLENNPRELQPQTAGGAFLEGDGPGSGAPENLAAIPDATPRAEPLHRYANRPYTVLGKTYTPLTTIGTYKARGVASWYGKKFHGKNTSIGEVYDMYSMSAAHTTLPIPSYARVTNLENKKSVIVRINDRGPFLHERVIDLSYTAAAKLGLIGRGQGQVEVESLRAVEGVTAPIAPIYREPIQSTPLAAESAPASPATGGVFLQLGAFSSQDGAEAFLRSMRSKLSDTGKKLSLLQHQGKVRVCIGPYANADTARSKALELQPRLGFKPVLSLR
jgi:rare lipoprotein A